MPIWGEHERPALPAQSITQRVRAGNAVPILSHDAVFDLALFGRETFAGYYATKVDYPHDAIPGVDQIANYDRYTHRASDADCKEVFLDCVKNYIYREAKAAGCDAEVLAEARAQVDDLGVSAFGNLLGYPRFDQPRSHPLAVLANLPCKIYLTLTFTTFVEDALRQAGKEPVTKMCRWRGPIDAPEEDLWLIPDHYCPTETHPLVYHLFGLDAHPETKIPLPDSLALTEDDHLEMLVNLAEGRGKESADRLPALVRGALFDDVVLLGFGLNSWAFRVIYYGLIRETGQEKDRRGLCCIQLPPEERAKQEQYVQAYLEREARFDVFWGDLHAYAKELSGS